MMTPQQILDDIRSDRVKKVILDADAFNEIDDQYALAYCIGSDKIDLLSVNASAFIDENLAKDFADAAAKSYEEIFKCYTKLRIPVDRYPTYLGARRPITEEPDFKPIDNAASRNIINTVKNSDEVVYVITSGILTNVVSACMMDPSICDNMVVIFLGAMAIQDGRDCCEGNLETDYVAGQILVNMDVSLVLLPCDPHGSADIKFYKNDFLAFEGDSDGAVFYRYLLPRYFASEERYQKDDFRWTMCDLMGVAAITHPESITFSVVPAPVFTDDKKFAIDSTRRRILYGTHPKSEIIVPDAVACIKKVIEENQKR